MRRRRRGVPLGPGDAYAPGNRFSASNQPLIAYLRFAYKLGQSDLDDLPAWVYEERFDIEARAVGSPGKDDMRRMMQALLADRFTLATHTERRTRPVYNLELVKAGTPGPALQRHTDDGSCDGAASAPVDPQRAPLPCDRLGPVPASAPNRGRMVGRRVTMARFAAILMNPFTGVDRPVLDATGLTGTFDLSLEWAMPPDPAQPSAFPADSGPAFPDALREQLGLKLQAGRGQVGVLVVDHIERPTPD
jgi:uncharacterized protein (TIGR03435 family)